MFTSRRVVVAISVPLLAYRVCEELYQAPDVEVLGPVATPEEALALAQCCAAPIVVCDTPIAQLLAPSVPAAGGRLVRLQLEGEPAPASCGDLASIDVRSQIWAAHLRALICDQGAPLRARGTPERRQSGGRHLRDLLDPASGPARSDAETGLPTGHALNDALARLARVGEPTLILFVDLTMVVATGTKEHTWLAEAGTRLRRMLRQGDLVFRLDRALYAVLAPCPQPRYVPTLRERLRWMLCGADFIAPDYIRTGDAYWTGQGSPAQAAAAAWNALKASRP